MVGRLISMFWDRYNDQPDQLVLMVDDGYQTGDIPFAVQCGD